MAYTRELFNSFPKFQYLSTNLYQPEYIRIYIKINIYVYVLQYNLNKKIVLNAN